MKSDQMMRSLSLSIFVVMLMASPGTLLAQDYDSHPILSDTFTFSLGAMRSSNSFKIESDLGDDIGDEPVYQGTTVVYVVNEIEAGANTDVEFDE